MAKGKKTGGREKGTPNKLTNELRERVTNFLNSNWSLVESDFQKLEPKERLVFYEKLMSYGLPKLQSVGLETPENLFEPKFPEWLLNTPEGSTA